MVQYFRVAWLTLLALFPLAGCSPGSGLPELTAKPDVSTYHLGPGDRLEIKVLGADELNGHHYEILMHAADALAGKYPLAGNAGATSNDRLFAEDRPLDAIPACSTTSARLFRSCVGD